MSTALLVAGYVLAVPFTLWVPGFRRMWNRREPWVFAVAQTGALLIALGWALKGSPVSVAVNLLWFLGFGLAYLRAGRRGG